MKIKQVHLIWTLLVLCLLLVSSAWGGVWIYASQQKVPPSLSLRLSGATLGNGLAPPAGSVRLGGLTMEGAKQKLASSKQALEQLRLIVRGGPAGTPDHAWTLAELGFSLDTRAAASELATLETGSLLTRAKTRWHFPEELNVAVNWDKSAFARALRGQWGYMDAGDPVDAKRTISDDNTISYTPHKDAYRLDTAVMFAQAVQALRQAVGQGWGSGNLAPIAIDITLKTVHPAVTLDRLKQQGVDRLIASFTTSFLTSGAGRAYNVEVTARTLNNWVLAPGEVFDYGKVVAAANEHYGYRAAPVILNGEFVPGIGGGICQVSSTLYNAALRAGLEIVERRNHSLPVAYLPIGQDATFAEGAIDFRIKNTTGKTLVIRASVEDRRLTVKLFGTMPKNVSYKITSKTLSTIAPISKEVARPSMAPGSRMLLTPGKPGYVVDTFRSKLVDGKVVATSRISRDTYKAQPAVYAVAPGQTSPGGNLESKKPLLEDGVAE